MRGDMRRPLAVLGATGRTGRLVVDEARRVGLRVRALVRDATQMPAAWRQDDDIALVPGDATHRGAVEALVAGSGAVVDVLGHSRGGPPDVLVRSMQHVVAAMRAHGVQRVVYLTGAGVSDPSDRRGVVDETFQALVRLGARDLYEDSVASTAVLRSSGLEWTVCRVTRLVDGPAGARLHVGPLGPTARLRVTRADVARWIVAELEARRHVHAAPVVTAHR